MVDFESKYGDFGDGANRQEIVIVRKAHASQSSWYAFVAGAAIAPAIIVLFRVTGFIQDFPVPEFGSPMPLLYTLAAFALMFVVWRLIQHAELFEIREVESVVTAPKQPMKKVQPEPSAKAATQPDSPAKTDAGPKVPNPNTSAAQPPAEKPRDMPPPLPGVGPKVGAAATGPKPVREDANV